MESFELQCAETVSDTVTLSRNMNSRTQYVVMCCDVEQHTDKVHESLILGRTTLQNVTYYHVVTVQAQLFIPEYMAPGSHEHDYRVEFSPVNAHFLLVGVQSSAEPHTVEVPPYSEITGVGVQVNVDTISPTIVHE